MSSLSSSAVAMAAAAARASPLSFRLLRLASSSSSSSLSSSSSRLILTRSIGSHHPMSDALSRMSDLAVDDMRDKSVATARSSPSSFLQSTRRRFASTVLGQSSSSSSVPWRPDGGRCPFSIRSSSGFDRSVGKSVGVEPYSQGAQKQHDSSSSRRRHRDQRRRRLDVAIVGAPNAGKSQLLNALAGSNVAAVSRKRHTTRASGGIFGARTIGDAQIVFIDTPGFLRKDDVRNEGGFRSEVRDLAREAEAGLRGVDYALVVVDAARMIDDGSREALVRLMILAASTEGREETSGGGGGDDDDDDDDAVEVVRERFAIVLNKVDLVNPKEKLLDLAADLGRMADECVRFVEGVSKVATAERMEGDKDEERFDDNDDDDDDVDKMDLDNMLDAALGVHDPPVKNRSGTLDGDANKDALSNDVPKSMEEAKSDVDAEADAAAEMATAAEADPHADLDDETASYLTALYPPVFFVSARYDDISDPNAPGVSDVLKHLLDRATPTSDPWPVGRNEATDMSPIQRVEEVIREKVYRCLHREVPHRVEQVNRAFRPVVLTSTSSTAEGAGEGEQRTKALRIDQDLIVRTRSHHRLVMGRGGMTLKRMEDAARKDLERVFGCRVLLNLNVKLTKSKQVRRETVAERSGVVRTDF